MKQRPKIYYESIGMKYFVTEQVRAALTLDPFQHLKENIPQKCMEQIISSINVISHHSVKTMEGYVRTEAVVSLSQLSEKKEYAPPTTSTTNSTTTASTTNNKKRPRTHHSKDSTSTGDFNLHFTYARSSMTSIHPCTVSYTIDVCNTADQPCQPLLWVHVYAAGVVPSSDSTSHAININDADDDDQWSDINDENESENNDDEPIDDNVHEPSRNAGSTSCGVNTPDVETSVSQIDNHKVCSDNGDNENGSTVDQYEAGMDPDVVSILVSHLSSMTKKLSVKSNELACYGDITIFFLLMTFPFYEHEWDIVGFLLKAVFDNDDSADGSYEE
jgi:hypothetical protein